LYISKQTTTSKHAIRHFQLFDQIAAVSPNVDAILSNSDGPEGLTRFPQARSVPTKSRTIYVSGIASVPPDGTIVGAANG
jgi:hypothetical protein